MASSEVSTKGNHRGGIENFSAAFAGGEAEITQSNRSVGAERVGKPTFLTFICLVLVTN